MISPVNKDRHFPVDFKDSINRCIRDIMIIIYTLKDLSVCFDRLTTIVSKGRGTNDFAKDIYQSDPIDESFKNIWRQDHVEACIENSNRVKTSIERGKATTGSKSRQRLFAEFFKSRMGRCNDIIDAYNEAYTRLFNCVEFLPTYRKDLTEFNHDIINHTFNDIRCIRKQSIDLKASYKNMNKR